MTFSHSQMQTLSPSLSLASLFYGCLLPQPPPNFVCVFRWPFGRRASKTHKPPPFRRHTQEIKGTHTWDVTFPPAHMFLILIHDDVLWWEMCMKAKYIRENTGSSVMSILLAIYRRLCGFAKGCTNKNARKLCHDLSSRTKLMPQIRNPLNL